MHRTTAVFVAAMLLLASCADDAPSEANLEASLQIDHEDEVIQSLAQQALGKTRGDLSQQEIAVRCTEFVTDYVTGLSLGVGDATASETGW